MKRWMLALLMFVVTPKWSHAQAQDGAAALDAQTAAVASHLRCPVCQGVSIQDSPSPLAQQMRAIVRQQLQEGKTPADVRSYFVARYGEWILLEPRASGFNVLVYAVPVVVVLGGLALVVVVVRRWTRPSDSLSNVSSSMTP